MNAAIVSDLQPHTWFQAMTEEDIMAVLAIERRIYSFPWTYGNFRDSIRSGYECVLVRADEGLVGYAVAIVAAGEAHLLNLSIADAYQRSGHGARLLDHMIGLARSKHAHSLYLEVRPSNLAARRLYSRHGFTTTGVRRDYYPAAAGRENALVLSLPL
jgi:ribosomal-protein-alanine N-acetyltransferase